MQVYLHGVTEHQSSYELSTNLLELSRASPLVLYYIDSVLYCIVFVVSIRYYIASFSVLYNIDSVLYCTVNDRCYMIIFVTFGVPYYPTALEFHCDA